MSIQFSISRRKKKPTDNFTRVKNLEYDKEGTVAERLSSQFTVDYDDGSHGFLFYKDKGDTWRPLDQGKKKTSSGMSASLRKRLWQDAALGDNPGIVFNTLEVAQPQGIVDNTVYVDLEAHDDELDN